MKKNPLLLACLFLFFGGITSYLTSIPNHFWLACSLAVLSLIVLVFQLFPFIWEFRKNRQFASLLFFFLVGGLNFSLNDYRTADLVQKNPNEERTFLAQIIEIKKATSQRQTFLVSIEQEKIGQVLEPASGKILVTYERRNAQDALNVDDEIAICTKIQAIKNRHNPGEFDAAYYYQSKGVLATAYVNASQVMVFRYQLTWNGVFTKWRDFLSHSMEEQLDGVFLGIAKALILGDKSNLEQEDVATFTNTGSMHVLAVSGLHIGLLLMMIQKVLEQFSRWISKRNALLFSLVLIWIYGFISGASPSVMRAVLMFSIIAAAQLFNRKNSAINGLFLSAIVLFMLDPWVFFDIGFQLTYAAMIGIFYLFEPIQALLHFSNKWIRLTWEGTAVGIAATIVTTPLTLYWFYQFPNYFALANLGVMVFGFLVLLGGMLFLFTSWIPGLGAVIAFLFSLTIIGLVKWVGLIDGIPGAVSNGFQLSNWELYLMFTLVLAWILWYQQSKKVKYLLAICSVFMIAFISYERFVVMQKESIIVMKSNQFMLVLQSEHGNLAFYEPKLNIIEKVPQEITAYEKFVGKKLQKHVLKKSNLQVSLGKQQLIIRKEKEGWIFSWNKHTYFFRQKGTPNTYEDRRLMSVKTLNYLDPRAEQFPFVLEI